ncbi:Transcription initiation factor TFIIH subunit 2 [Monocercomonoides exilis]|uniref:Transcription initiation factor TFIIH subunit 2 n=1 Tax=Monocercomonoides exilis TaxID=2049356 RepID=UPI003559801E|nr:Transcription initiation factor TFIIH subunit 2 [Monocercomonoides exilis]|eukprot:MONOS_1092.1-p1 / transcript=MONOS_1092.1 / gene=MONOS_1092 / organism=Monocercomonoides_exilis_PA203 / gene_product=Transcription initiation factor TFIIH subunit 2 / transcript_product=Transcription initiation factor TFIIH subunit 2 / location=Mono_scaffold00018:192204-193786(+) / protein_length=463 / sequence_SO=supercontig / SO=protein_coding / is_pseudo=false
MTKISTGEAVSRDMLRYLVILLDCSQKMETTDFSPDRMTFIKQALVSFIREFFDQNPLSRLGVVLTKNGKAHILCEPDSSCEEVLEHLSPEINCSGEPSLQNGLQSVLNSFKTVPSYGSKEVLIVYGNTKTCDPGNIYSTIGTLKQDRVKCSVISLDVEMHLLKVIAHETNGTHNVALNEEHCNSLLQYFTVPSPSRSANLTIKKSPHIRIKQENTEKSTSRAFLIKIGFPTTLSTSSSSDLSTLDPQSLTSLHIQPSQQSQIASPEFSGIKSSSIQKTSVSSDQLQQKAHQTNSLLSICPQCLSVTHSIPSDCSVCGLFLIAAPHLARSNHHLFPVASFDKQSYSSSSVLSAASSYSKESDDQKDKDMLDSDNLSWAVSDSKKCFGCQSRFVEEEEVFQCPKCQKIYCKDCDFYIHSLFYFYPFYELMDFFFKIKYMIYSIKLLKLTFSCSQILSITVHPV